MEASRLLIFVEDAFFAADIDGVDTGQGRSHSPGSTDPDRLRDVRGESAAVATW